MHQLYTASLGLGLAVFSVVTLFVARKMGSHRPLSSTELAWTAVPPVLMAVAVVCAGILF